MSFKTVYHVLYVLVAAKETSFYDVQEVSVLFCLRSTNCCLTQCFSCFVLKVWTWQFIDFSPHWQFAPWMFRPCVDVSPHTRHFAPWAIHPETFCPMDLAQNVYGRFAPRPWAKRLWANCPWGEMSSAGWNVYGANRPWANCPYMGRTVCGAKSPDTEFDMPVKIMLSQGCTFFSTLFISNCPLNWSKVVQILRSNVK